MTSNVEAVISLLIIDINPKLAKGVVKNVFSGCELLIAEVTVFVVMIKVRIVP